MLWKSDEFAAILSLCQCRYSVATVQCESLGRLIFAKPFHWWGLVRVCRIHFTGAAGTKIQGNESTQSCSCWLWMFSPESLDLLEVSSRGVFFWPQQHIVNSCSGAIGWFSEANITSRSCDNGTRCKTETLDCSAVIPAHTKERTRLRLCPGTAALYSFGLLHYVTTTHLQWRPLVWRIWPCVAYSDVRDTQYPLLCLELLRLRHVRPNAIWNYLWKVVPLNRFSCNLWLWRLQKTHLV